MALSVFQFICTCMTIRKSGNPWWSAIIPFYNNYILFKMAKKPKLFRIYLPLQIVFSILFIAFYVAYFTFFMSLIMGMMFTDPEELWDSFAQTVSGSVGWLIAIGAGILLVWLVSVGITVLNVICDIGIARAFGRSAGFGVGLFFIPVIFYAILAFDNATEYQFDGPADGSAETGTYYA